MPQKTIRQALKELTQNSQKATSVFRNGVVGYEVRVGRSRFTIAKQSTSQGVRKG